MRTGVALAAILGGMLLPCAGLAQPRPVPTAPGSADIAWNRMVRLSDGRTFVTDGGMAIDAAIAKPAALPTDVLPHVAARRIEAFLAAQTTHDFGLGQLSASGGGRTYDSPSGVRLNTTYLDLLRRNVSAARVRLRMKGDLDPVVVVVDGKPAGVMMPVKQ